MKKMEAYNNTAPQGVGAALTINGHTRAFEKFFGNLPPHYGVPQNQDQLHVTILSASETAIPINSDQDLILLRNAGREIHRRLAGLPLQQLVLRPEGDELQKYGRYLAIPLRSLPFMEALRSDLIEITQEEMGVEVEHEIGWYVSVVRPPRTRVKAKDNLPPFPASLHVKGFDFQRRIYEGSIPKKSSKPPYRNKPSLRRVV